MSSSYSYPHHPRPHPPSVDDSLDFVRQRDAENKPPLIGLSTFFAYVFKGVFNVLKWYGARPSVQADVYMLLWSTEAYYEFFVGSMMHIIRSMVSNPSSVILNPFKALSALAWYVLLQVIGIIVVVLYAFAKLTRLEDAIYRWVQRNGGGNSIVNMDDPTMFISYTSVVKNAIKIFSRGYEHPVAANGAPHNNTELAGERVRYFNLDVAKTLLLFSAAMYERNELINNEAIMHLHKHPEVAKSKRAEAEAPIHKIAARWGMRFYGTSDLNSYGGAFCGIWWQEDSNWLVVSFKGTTPFNGAEWLKDLTVQKTNANAFLFGALHKGFYSALFTNYESHIGYSPYGTIVQAIKYIATHLQKSKDHEINVYITGHSLGSAIAEVFYARAVKSPQDFGPKVVVRNAYLFGSPRVGDINWASGYYSSINIPFGNEQMMYRIVNGYDIVCHVPPGLGDIDGPRDYLQPNSFMNYAHIGDTIKITGARKPQITGNKLAPGVDIHIVAERDEGSSSGMVREPRLNPMRLLQMLIIPPLRDHFPSRYLMRLNRLAPLNVPYVPAPSLAHQIADDITLASHDISNNIKKTMRDTDRAGEVVMRAGGRVAHDVGDVAYSVEKAAKRVAEDVVNST